VERITKKLSNLLLDLLFPVYCTNCQKEGLSLCEECQKSIVEIKSSACYLCQHLSSEGICPKCRKKTNISQAVFYGYYHDPVLKNAIHALKYNGLKVVAPALSELLSSKIKPHLKPSENYLLVPVPLHRSKKANRGFNQSELLCQNLSKTLEMPYQNLLKRQKNTKPQIELKYRERQTNIKKSFAVLKKPPENTTIILIDDVVTSGATIRECALVLKEAGANNIWVAALAHG
jgi:competence protein ComFC